MPKLAFNFYEMDPWCQGYFKELKVVSTISATNHCSKAEKCFSNSFTESHENLTVRGAECPLTEYFTLLKSCLSKK